MKKINIENAIEEVKTSYGNLIFFKNDLYLGGSLREYGEWAQKELNFLSGFVDENSVVVDAGAFIGSHTIAFSNFVGPNGYVYSFEPHPTYFEVLSRNVHKNNLENVKVLNFGLSDKNGKMKVKDLDIHSKNSFGSVRLSPTSSDVEMVTVDVKTIDSFKLSACHLIKVDVEGMESLVLLGAQSTIKRFQPFIYAECNSADDGWPVVMMMKSYGYKVYIYSEEAYNPENYKNNDFNMFGHARELALVCVPPHLNDLFLRKSLGLEMVLIDMTVASMPM